MKEDKILRSISLFLEWDFVNLWQPSHLGVKDMFSYGGWQASGFKKPVPVRVQESSNAFESKIIKFRAEN